MKVLNLIQGEQEWLEARAKHNTASEAPAMMGVSPYLSRADLLRQKYNGSSQEVTPELQEVFNRGHESEAAMRPWAEEMVGEDLFPATVAEDDGNLSASLDGMTMVGDTLWEHKQFNDAKAGHVSQLQTVPDPDYWQVVQQLMITGAKRCLYSVGNSPDNVAYCWMEPNDQDFMELRAGWDQFSDDLANYVPEELPAEAVGHTMKSMPALRIELTGMVTASNLAVYKETAMAVFDSINTDLQTDQDFADAENTVKWCKDVEDRLDAAKQHALSQTEDIDALFRAIDDLIGSARQKRLELDRLVKARKVQVRDEIRSDAEKALAKHLQDLEERLDHRVRIPHPDADFAGAMKNKRNLASLRDAVDQVLADAKIASSAQADTILANLKAYDEIVGDYKTLFPDIENLAFKAPDDFAAAVKLRISEHKEAEEKRIEEARQAEARRIEAEHEAEERRKEEARQAEERKTEPPAAAAPVDPDFSQPEPAQEEPGDVEQHLNFSHIPKVTMRRWQVTATFEIEAPDKYGENEVVGRLRGALEGFSSLRDVSAELIEEPTEARRKAG